MKRGWLRHLNFIIVDIFSIEVSLFCTFLLYRAFSRHIAERSDVLCIMLPLIHLFMCLALDAYSGILQRGYLKELIAVFRLEFAVFFLLIYLFYFLMLIPEIQREILSFYFLFCVPLTYGMRLAHKFFLRRHYSNIKYSRQIVIAATRAAAEKMMGSVSQTPITNCQFFGLAILDESMIGGTIGGVTVSADRNTMIDYVRQNVVDEVFINIPENPADTLLLSRQLLDMGVTVDIYMEEVYQSLPNRSISNVFGYNVLSAAISPVAFRNSLGKRLFDILGGIIGCILAVGIGLIIGPIIYLKSPGPILFSQIRIGKGGRPFKIYKFRSMYMDAEERKKELLEKNKISSSLMFKMDDDPRIIKGIGRFIRKTSLDEFPQFFNVLKGDMSMVGPRPPTVDEYEQYSPHHKRRLSMLPGITGLWQISGRSSITDFETVMLLDTRYIENWSMEQDIKIIFKTLIKIWQNDEAS